MSKSTVEKHFDKIAGEYDYYKNKNSFYYENLKKLLGELIPRNKKVLEIGCGTGDLLVNLKPKYGYGQDISSAMIEIANAKHSNESHIHFSTKWPNEKFDYIFMADVIEHLEKPKETFGKISRIMDRNTIFINTMANPIWEPLLMFWEKMGWKMEEGEHKRIWYNDLKFMLQECGFKIIKHDYKLLIPFEIPVLTKFMNKYLGKYFRKLAFIEYFVAIKS